MDTIYVSGTGCSHCTTVIRFMNSHPSLAQKVSVRDIEADDGALRDWTALGIRARPVAIIDGQVVKGDMPIISAVRMKYGVR